MPDRISKLNHLQIRGTEVDIRDLMKLRYVAKKISFFRQNVILSQKTGTHHSKLRGRGMEFDELRIYQAGDDIRHMDWRVTARTGQPHTKLYHDERERPIFLVIDNRHAMHFGTKVAFKSVIAAQIAAILGWAAVDHGDRLGAVFCDGSKLIDIRPQARMKGILPILKLLAGMTPIAESIDLAKALFQLRRVVKPGSLIFIISDFTQLGNDFERYLSRLRQHNEIVCCFVYDYIEKEPPPPGRYPITDGVNRLVMNTKDENFSRFYREIFQTRYDFFVTMCIRKNIPWIEFSTQQTVSEILASTLGRWKN